MIIKSLARKQSTTRGQSTFGQLIDYMDKEAEEAGFTYNCWNDGSDKEDVETEFLENSQHLPKRKNGNILYHEILVLPSNPDIGHKTSVGILRDLVDQYVEHRAPTQMVYAQIHTDTDYLHCHLMISANAVGSNKRVRLTRNDFSEIKREVERYKLEKYGDKFPDQVFTRCDKSKVNESHREYEFKHRTGKPSRKDQIRVIVGKLILESQTRAEFAQVLLKHNLEFYRRGKSQTPGIIDIRSGKRYRLKTLGLYNVSEKFHRLDELVQIDKLEKRINRDRM